MNKLRTYLFLLFLPSSIWAQNWQSLEINLNSGVKVLYTDTVDNLLYLGGNFWFNSGNGADTVRGIASWDGTTLSRLGKGIDYFNISSVAGPVYAIVRFQNEIYVGGMISMAGDYWVNGIAKWNGINWDTIDGGVTTVNGSGIIRDMEVINNELYIAGAFSFVGANQIPANGIAKFDGVQWSAIHNFPQWNYNNNNINLVDEIAEYNSEIYVAGQFSDAAPIDTMNHISRWNGTTWEQLGWGIGGTFSSIENMLEYKGKLYVAGAFDKIGNPNNPGNRIAAWNGTNWEEVGDIWGYTPTSFAYIYDMTVFNDELYVVGNFQGVGNMYATHIAKYDGTEWCTLGDTFNIRIDAVEAYNNELFVGGEFTTINSDTIRQMAKWVGGNFVNSCEVFVGIENNFDEQFGLNIYPNPNNGTFMLEKSNLGNTKIEIYNISGQLILQKLFVDNTTQVNLTDYPKGLYLIKTIADNQITVKKIIYQ